MKVAIVLLAIGLFQLANAGERQRMLYSTNSRNHYANTITHVTNLLHQERNGLHVLRRHARRHLTNRRVTGRMNYMLGSHVSRHRAHYNIERANVQRHAAYQLRNRVNQFTGMRSRNIGLRTQYGRVRYQRRNAHVSAYNRILSRNANVQRVHLRSVTLHGRAYNQYANARGQYLRANAKAEWVPAKVQYLSAVKVVPVLVSTRGKTYPMTHARVQWVNAHYGKK